MRILIVIPAIGSVYGGPSKIAVELAQALGNLGVSVDIITTNANGSNNLDVPLYAWITEQSYRIKYFPYWGSEVYKLSFSLMRWLFQHITDYDLVHTIGVFSVSVLAANWACQFHKVPYVINPQGMLEPWALSYKRVKKRLYYGLFENNALQRASAIHMLAASEVNGVKSLNLNPPLVIVPNGIHCQDLETLPDPELFYQSFPKSRGKKLILFLGRIDPKKGLDLLAPAFAKVHALFPETHIIIAGPDNIGFLPTAQGYFTATGCIDSVTFTGMLTGSLKYAALAAANIYVAPSYSEGFSMSVLEGMGAGLPCVITTGCNFSEAAAANAAYVVNIDPEEIANALIEYLSDSQKAKEMGDRARQFIFQNYTWEQAAKKLIQVYSQIIEERQCLKKEVKVK
jgi:glycosyltransferase involved in cell wall biosynthesis